jgi:hypothetical protein
MTLISLNLNLFLSFTFEIIFVDKFIYGLTLFRTQSGFSWEVQILYFILNLLYR